MRKGLVYLFAILAIGFYSCESNDSTELLSTGEDLTLKSTEIATTDILVDCVSEIADYEADYFTYAEKLLRQISHYSGYKNKLVNSKGLKHYRSDNAPDVSIDTAATDYPIVITLDYGDSTVLRNGNVLSGIIVIEITGVKNTDGYSRIVTYNDFAIDSTSIEGSVTSLYTIGGDSIRIKSTTENLIFTLADGTTITRVSEKNREWLSGSDTPLEHSDDSIQVTGQVETTTSAGESFSKVIIEPLLKTESCRHYVQGIVQFIQDGTEIARLNYGEGECDDVATLTTSGGEVIEIELGGNKPEASNNNKNSKHRKGK